MRVLVTGAAGFIGFHLARRLLAEGHTVFGIDGFTPYYDPALKRRRRDILAQSSRFTNWELMLEDAGRLAARVAEASADVVFHLAAQAGVRYGAENPRAYIDSNIVGTFNLLEALKQRACRHLVVASTSSVYGDNREQPFREDQPADRPLSLYAATKIATEALVCNHAHHHRHPVTAARLFTVYGPWGRPDMAFFKFTDCIIKGQPIDVYGFGKMTRDFTYIDDVVEALHRLAERPPEDTGGNRSGIPYRVVNVGGGQPVGLETFIATIESEVGRPAIRRMLPMPAGDVPATWADTTQLQQLTGFKPTISVARGVREFVAWYRSDYGAP